MSAQSDSPFDALERIFHEPNRMAIMSALAGAGRLSFTELRDACGLTDGNLNRHLKSLEEAGAVRITKRFVDAKPQTTIAITADGLEHFGQYLETLAAALTAAKAALAEVADARTQSRRIGSLLPARA